jgi:hypothetical protein
MPDQSLVRPIRNLHALATTFDTKARIMTTSSVTALIEFESKLRSFCLLAFWVLNQPLQNRSFIL